MGVVNQTFILLDEDKEECEVLLYCEREKNGRLNMLYNPNGDTDKYENRWFSFSLVDDKKIQEKRAELEKQSKESLVEALLLHVM